MVVRAQNEWPDDEEDGEGVTPNDEGEDGEDGEEGTPEDAPVDSGEEQEIGGEGDVDDVPGGGSGRQARQPSRGESRFQRLANENADLKRRLDGLERQPAQRPATPQEETEEQFRARISLLPPDERMEARYERSERRNEQRLNAMQVEQRLSADKLAFDASVTAQPRRQRYVAEVEAAHQEALRAGNFVPRESLYYYLLGKKVDANGGTKPAKEQRKAAQRRVSAQQTRPVSGRSDTRGAGERRPNNETSARAKRLDGMQI
jgi:hypothetical protein